MGKAKYKNNPKRKQQRRDAANARAEKRKAEIEHWRQWAETVQEALRPLPLDASKARKLEALRLAWQESGEVRPDQRFIRREAWVGVRNENLGSSMNEEQRKRIRTLFLEKLGKKHPSHPWLKQKKENDTHAK